MNLRPAVRKILSQMATVGAVPNHCDVSRLGPFTIVAAYDELPCTTISDRVVTGMHFDPEIAVLKCFSEYVERRAMCEWMVRNPAYEANGSEGFAAFPVELGSAPWHARERALLESIERFVWATWWDDPSVSAEIDLVAAETFGSILQPLRDTLKIETLFRVRPRIVTDVIVEIYFAEISGMGGFLSGGTAYRAGGVGSSDSALSELLRHGMAYVRMVSKGRSPLTPYEQRLKYFADGNGSELVRQRLRRGTTGVVELPHLILDEPVDHELSDIFAVHKCQFIGQPDFLGGPVERLCL